MRQLNCHAKFRAHFKGDTAGKEEGGGTAMLRVIKRHGNLHTYIYIRTNRERNQSQVVASAAVAIAVSFE